MKKYLIRSGIFLLIGNIAIASESPRQLLFQINENSPQWILQYTIIPGEPYSEYHNILNTITILNAKTGKVIQKLKLPNDGLPNSDLDASIFQDVNFDGYKDIVIHSGIYVSGNYSDAFWLFNPSSKKYVYNSQLSGMTNVVVDSKKKLISSHNSCCAGLSNTDEIYHWNQNKLELIEESKTEEYQEPPPDLKTDACKNAETSWVKKPQPSSLMGL